MKKLRLVICISIALLALASCKDRRVIRPDTRTSGVAAIVVDECLAPIIEEQVSVFEALNREATILPTYANEYEAYDLFVKDSMRVIIGTRELTNNERKTIKDRKQRLYSQRLAVDGIALIVNQHNTDSLISISDFRKIVTGDFKSWKDLNPNSKLNNIALVFDSPNSSTVRYIKDSIAGDKPLGDNVRAISRDTSTVDIRQRTPNQQVLDYVASNPNALGIIGVNWISNPTDTTSLSFTDKIRVMSVSKEDKPTLKNSYKPLPYQFMLGLYPLQRDVYIIISDAQGGLPSGFVGFSAGERGQRIVLKSGLLPATQLTRLVSIDTQE